MSRLTPATLESYIEAYGWTFHKLGQACWLSGWQGDKRSYPLTISLTESWVLMEVRPYVALPEENGVCGDLSRYLLQLNHMSHMVKLAIDDNQGIVLSLQLFANHLPYEEFADALGVLGYYAELLYDDIYVRSRSSGRIVEPRTKFLT